MQGHFRVGRWFSTDRGKTLADQPFRAFQGLRSSCVESGRFSPYRALSAPRRAPALSSSTTGSAVDVAHLRVAGMAVGALRLRHTQRQPNIWDHVHNAGSRAPGLASAGWLARDYERPHGAWWPSYQTVACGSDFPSRKDGGLDSSGPKSAGITSTAVPDFRSEADGAFRRECTNRSPLIDGIGL